VKNRRDDEVDCNGFKINFKLRGGINFIPMGRWG